MELSRCPELRELFRAAQDYQLGVATAEEVKERLRHMESLYNLLVDAYQQQRKQYDKAAPVWQQTADVEGSFKRLRKGLEDVRAWCASRQPSLLAEGLEEARLGTDELFEHFERMQQVEQTAPRLSSNPYLHEVLRIAQGVQEGKLGVEVLADILVRMKGMLKQSAQQMFGSAAPQEDADAQKEAQRYMDRVYAGLKEAEVYLTDRQTAHLRKGLEAARVAMEELYVLKSRVENPPASNESRACWRCSEDVPVGEASCARCGFRFPSAVQVAEGAPAADPEAAEQAAWLKTPAGHTPTEVSERLCAAIDDVREGGPLTNLLAAVQEARGRVARARSTVESAPPALGADAILLEEAANMVLQSLDLMDSGLDLIESYSKEPEGGRLSAGVEKYLLGSDQLMELQQREESTDAHGAL